MSDLGHLLTKEPQDLSQGSHRLTNYKKMKKVISQVDQSMS